MQQLITIAQKFQVEQKVIYLKNQQYLIAKGNVCLFHQIGPLIDIFWDSIKGNVFLNSSNSKNFQYIKNGPYQLLTKISFRHAHICPYRQQQIQKSQKFYKPCACVMLKNQNDFLITRRKLALNSFPGAWVLPGGHLQKGQSLIEGGLRQASEEVGLNARQAEVALNEGAMAWQSAFYKQNKILSSAFVVFFAIKTPSFEVKAQQSEIEQFKWKDIFDDKDQMKYISDIKNGYGQAHLNYLSFYRKQNYQIKQNKKWIMKEKTYTNHFPNM